MKIQLKKIVNGTVFTHPSGYKLQKGMTGWGKCTENANCIGDVTKGKPCRSCHPLVGGIPQTDVKIWVPDELEVEIIFDK
jgi:hypothetical protein